LNINVGVKLLKLFKACLGTRNLANMLFSAPQNPKTPSLSLNVKIYINLMESSNSKSKK
jgi:hypothetical protein